jgi:BMFP domain-containing protein YqiC
MDPKLIDELSKRLYRSLPENLKQLPDDLKQNFSGILESGLSKFNLVSRDEFEVQKLVLAKCRKQIDALKSKLDAMNQEEE